MIDRFEGDIAVIEIDGVTRDFPKACLPRNVKAGDSVIIDNGEIRLNPADSAKRKAEIQDLMDDLFEP